MSSTKKLLTRFLPKDRIKINEPLALHTYIKLGGPADFFTVAKSADELAGAVEAAEKAGIRWFILGGGSNILVGDLGVRGLVIKNEAQGIRVSRRLSRWRKFARSPSPARPDPGSGLGASPSPDLKSGSGWPQTAAVSLANLPTSIANSSRNSSNYYLIAESGVLMSKLAAFANQHGLGGLEMFMSVPGTLGGAIYNNSHYRPERNEFIGNLVDSAEVIEGRGKREEGRGREGLEGREGPDGGNKGIYRNLREIKGVGLRDIKGKIKIVDREWFKFGYDYSQLQKEKAVVLRVKFKLKKADPEKLRAKSLELMQQRNRHQPIGRASCGCMFKNPSRIEGSDPSRMSARLPARQAGKLIDEAGMKGVKVGGVSVSATHANFMVNDGTGKVGDVLELMNRVKKRVKEKFGVELEPEIFFVGEFNSKMVRKFQKTQNTLKTRLSESQKTRKSEKIPTF